MKKFFILHESIFDDAINPKKADSLLRESAIKLIILLGAKAPEYKSVAVITRETYEEMKRKWYYKDESKAVYLTALFDIDDTASREGLNLTPTESIKFLAEVKGELYN